MFRFHYNPIAPEDLLINNPVTVSVQGLEMGTKEATLLFPISYTGTPSVTDVIRHWQNYLRLGIYNKRGKLIQEVDANAGYEAYDTEICTEYNEETNECVWVTVTVPAGQFGWVNYSPFWI